MFTNTINPFATYTNTFNPFAGVCSQTGAPLFNAIPNAFFGYANAPFTNPTQTPWGQNTSTFNQNFRPQNPSNLNTTPTFGTNPFATPTFNTFPGFTPNFIPNFAPNFAQSFGGLWNNQSPAAFAQPFNPAFQNTTPTWFNTTPWNWHQANTTGFINPWNWNTTPTFQNTFPTPWTNANAFFTPFAAAPNFFWNNPVNGFPFANPAQWLNAGAYNPFAFNPTWPYAFAGQTPTATTINPQGIPTQQTINPSLCREAA